MNTNRFFRATMASQYTTKKFFKKVTHDIYQQLSQWDPQAKVEVEAWRSYVVNLQYLGKNYRAILSKNEIDLLQNEQPYALDFVIWRTLIKNGLQLNADEGNYLSIVFNKPQQHFKIS